MLKLIILFPHLSLLRNINIYKNIHKIARDNFNNILVKVKNDVQRWKNLKVSIQGRISTVKINLLPRFNFLSFQNNRHILNISRSNQKGGGEGRTTRTQKSLLYIITYIQQKTLPSINGRRPGPTNSRRCTFT